MQFQKQIQQILFRLNNQNGAAIFFFVLIMATTGLTMAINGARLGMDDLTVAYATELNQESLMLAEGCAENVLSLIRRDNDYGLGMGVIPIALDEGSCTAEVIDTGSNRRQIIITVMMHEYEKIIDISIILTSEVIILDSWEEI